jgi:hypothetical protein
MEHLPIQLLAFAIATVPVVWLSWRSLKSRKNHGFYRFFSWECILWLFGEEYQAYMKRSKRFVSWIF